jgi:dCMP deaminase
MNKERQIKWDLRFLKLAEHISSWSKDPSTKVGAVIATGNIVVSHGYNGFPKNITDSEIHLNDRNEKYPRIIHAEVNSILNAKRDVSGYSIYCLEYPCPSCTAIIIQSGITRIVSYAPKKDFVDRWPSGISSDMLNNADVSILLYDRETLKQVTL